MRQFYSTLFFVLLAFPLLAQPLGGTSKEEVLLTNADSARSIGSYFDALEKYEEAYDQFEDETLRPTIALMNLRVRDIKAANRLYKLVFRKSEPTDTTNNIHRYHYGRALKMDGQYDEAKTYLQAFLMHNTDEELEKRAKLEIEGIDLYRDAPQETSEVALEGLGRTVNGSFSEYSPVLSPDGEKLYFATSKASKPIIEGEGEGENAHVMIFVSEKDDKGWGKAKVLGKEINRPGLTSANPAISADGRRMIFNRMRVETNVISEAKLYVADIDEDGWKSANPIAGINSDDYLVLQPAVGELYGREVLFFVSDMDGGFGGMDIYYANYEGDGRYGAPVNLGPTINTFADDKTPFYFDGTLYFSTDGRPTMGGYDLFYSAWNGSEWSAPENMGPGFNSTVDDRSLSVFGDGLVGFMTSNREGGRSVRSKTCCDDIYGFQIASIYANLVVGVFDDAKQALLNGTVELQPIVNGNAEGLGEQKTRDDGNRFDFGLALETEYEVIASHPGYFPDTFEVSTLGLEESKEIQQPVFLRKIPPPPPPVERDVKQGEAVTLENILYDFESAKIKPEAEDDLRFIQRLMEKYPDMVIELGSHTDSRGNAAFNLGLSKRRAASARKWLIVNGGIEGPRIKTKGYGKTVPQTVSDRLAERIDFLNTGDVLTDDFINSLPDKETRERAHDFNRRTEFTILEGPAEITIDGSVIERKTTVIDRQSEPRSSVPSPAPAAAPGKK
ncbi:MAG: OmpA family protein, partial [Bacteroidota bacterium]